MIPYPHLLFSALDLIGLIFLALYTVQMVLAALLPPDRPRAAPDEALNFTFVVPALNEAQVVEATLRNLRELAPTSGVVVIDDHSDDRTAHLVQALADRDPWVRLLRRAAPEARTGKGRALEWAAHRLLAELTRAGADLTREVFVIVDADARLTPALLPEARRVLADSRVVGAQARVCIRPSVARLRARTLVARALEQQQDLEFFLTWHLQGLRQRWHTAGLFGNGQFMRASYLHHQLSRGQAAWPDCLLEDYASTLEMRLAHPEHRLARLHAAVTQQGLGDLRRFLRQRARWTQGTLQCLGYVPRLWTARVPWLARLDMTYFLLGPWMNALIVLTLLTQPVRWLEGAHGLVLTPAVSALIALVNLTLQAQWVIRYARHQRLRPGAALFLFPGLLVYGSALLLSLPLAYWHHFTGRRTWDKSARHAEGVTPVESQT